MTTPLRRWLAFSLRTLFVVVTALGITLGWISWNWRIAQLRREAIALWRAENAAAVFNAYGNARHPHHALTYIQFPKRASYSEFPEVDEFLAIQRHPPPVVSWIRRKLGDRAVAGIMLNAAPSPRQQRQLALLFPEARLVWADGRHSLVFMDLGGEVPPR